MFASFIGDIRPIAFRAGSLPPGWVQTNGDKVLLTSYTGKVLNSLDSNFKTDWGIAVDGNYINLPDLFDDDGNGYFPRPVDGVTRQVGSKQEDAIRNIQNNMQIQTVRSKTKGLSPPFYTSGVDGVNMGYATGGNGDHDIVWIGFNAGLAVNTAPENRPKNIGFIYAMYVGIEQ
jgi:hypothetical protein